MHSSFDGTHTSRFYQTHSNRPRSTCLYFENRSAFPGPPPKYIIKDDPGQWRLYGSHVWIITDISICNWDLFMAWFGSMYGNRNAFTFPSQIFYQRLVKLKKNVTYRTNSDMSMQGLSVLRISEITVNRNWEVRGIPSFTTWINCPCWYIIINICISTTEQHFSIKIDSFFSAKKEKGSWPQ